MELNETQTIENEGSILISGSADISFGSGATSWTTSISSSSHPGIAVPISSLSDGTTVYIPVTPDELKGLPLPSTIQWQSIALSAMQACGTNHHPFSKRPIDAGIFSIDLLVLKAAASIASVSKSGPDIVDGIPTTKYSAVASVQSLDNFARCSNMGMSLITEFHGTTLTINAYVDSHDRIVRDTISTFEKLPAQQSLGIAASTDTTTATFDLSNFGEKVFVTVPPADEVVSSSELGKLTTQTAG